MLLSLILEYRRHARWRNRLRAAVLVDGTRGKSFTARLVAAGLCVGEHLGPVLAKTTGTSARWILPGGSDREILRAGPANIREMAQGLALAEKLGAKAYVAECMAVLPGGIRSGIPFNFSHPIRPPAENLPSHGRRLSQGTASKKQPPRNMTRRQKRSHER